AGGPLTAMTFDPPPDIIIRPADAPQRICTPDDRAALLLEAGCDYVVTAKTDLQLLRMSPEDFIARIIVGRFNPRYIVEGPNFFFGHFRAGNVETLKNAGKKYGFQTQVVEPVTVELAGVRARVSSTLIRQLIEEARIEDADRLLTRPFSFVGQVIGGEKVGRVLQYPTANIDPGMQVIPCDGVYAGLATVHGKPYRAAISIGRKPTIGDNLPRLVEANLLDASGDFYHEKMRLRFIRFLREQRKFDSLDELKAQISRDVRQTREIVTL
ncbi:MAG TPA: bifunctional riboflavin kinase/FMN adenylyltransferase, partial [Phycisphaerae bacterium]|nr:bifunctional riboflavin kinase/FMN adenylyltransferase [Phycisphaerae bacterium]